MYLSKMLRNNFEMTGGINFKKNLNVDNIWGYVI